MPDGRVFLGVADVSGKGLHAALIAAALHTLARTALAAGASLGKLLSHANDYLQQFLPEGRFVTMVAVVIDPKNRSKAEYANAGHPPALAVTRQAAKLRQLESCLNMPLGLEADAFQSLPLQLGRDEMLVMYSDGLTDVVSPTGEMLGTERLLELVQHVAASGDCSSMKSMTTRLFAEINGHRGRLHAARRSNFAGVPKGLRKRDVAAVSKLPSMQRYMGRPKH